MQPASNRYTRRFVDGRLCAHANDALTAGADGQPDYADPTYCPVLGRLAEARQTRG